MVGHQANSDAQLPLQWLANACSNKSRKIGFYSKAVYLLELETCCQTPAGAAQ
jgi:hypothetical protein